MNSNVDLFDEDRPLEFEDMDWPDDSVFSGGCPPGSSFDLSKATADFLDSGAALQNSNDPELASAVETRTNNNHISPRGVADNAEKSGHAHADRRGANAANEVSLKNCANVVRHQQSNRDSDCPSRVAPSISRDSNAAKEGYANTQSASKEKPYNETRPRDSGNSVADRVAVNTEESVHDLESHQKFEMTSGQVTHLVEDLNATLQDDITFGVHEDAHEFSGAGFEGSQSPNDQIESLMHLPDHVQFNDGLDPTILQIHLSNRELLALPNQSTRQVDLSSNVVLPSFDVSLSRGTEMDGGAKHDAMASFRDSQSILEAQTRPSDQPETRLPPNMHPCIQTLQEVAQAYHANLHPQLQAPLTSDYANLGQTFGFVRGPTHIPLRRHQNPELQQPASPGSLPVPLHATEGIQKKKCRRKGTRDPTKPPPTPRRRKAYTPRRKKAEQAVHSVDAVAERMSEEDRKENDTMKISSSGGFLCSSALQHPREGGRPSTTAFDDAGNSTTDAIRQVSGPGQSSNVRNAAHDVNSTEFSLSEAQGEIESGRMAKKTGKKGGRVNPENAHLSVEERRSLRAKRNRESAEKSRVRRKVQTAELEMSVAELRDENKSLKSEMIRFQTQLSAMSVEVTKHAKNPTEQEKILREQTPALFNALVITQRVINDCPRTFSPHPHSSEIQLKIKR